MQFAFPESVPAFLLHATFSVRRWPRYAMLAYYSVSYGYCMMLCLVNLSCLWLQWCIDCSRSTAGCTKTRWPTFGAPLTQYLGYALAFLVKDSSRLRTCVCFGISLLKNMLAITGRLLLPIYIPALQDDGRLHAIAS